MSTLDWARREVEIACKRERGDKPEGEWDYGCACYESALKAYECLLGDEHSGFSWSITARILKRLMDGKPLTPIEDNEEDWGEVASLKNGCKEYQCKRKSSLFKSVYSDGRVEYTDVDRVICVDDESGSTYTNGFIRKIIDEMYPITMPYTANKTYRVYCRDYLTDRKNGDFDTIAVLYVKDSDGFEEDIHRFFKDNENGPGWIEIDVDEYVARVEMHNKRVAEEASE